MDTTSSSTPGTPTLSSQFMAARSYLLASDYAAALPHVLLIRSLQKYRRAWTVRAIECYCMLEDWKNADLLVEQYKREFVRYRGTNTDKSNVWDAVVLGYAAEANFRVGRYASAWVDAQSALEVFEKFGGEYAEKAEDMEGKLGVGEPEIADLLQRIAEKMYPDGAKEEERQKYEPRIIPGRVMKPELVRLQRIAEEKRAEEVREKRKAEICKKYGLEYSLKLRCFSGREPRDVLKVFEKVIISGDDEMAAAIIQDSRLQRLRSKSRYRTALYYAVKHDSPQHTTSLISAGFKPNNDCAAFSIKRPYKPLHVAIKFNSRKAAVVLLNHGADPNFIALSNPQTTPLYWALVGPGNIKMLELLVEHGLIVNRPNVGSGFHPLHQAVIARKPEMVKFLLDKGAWIDASTYVGSRHAMHYAARSAHVETLMVLVEAGVDVNVRSGDGESPLDFAYASWKFHRRVKGSVEVEEYLNAKGGIYYVRRKRCWWEVMKMPFRIVYMMRPMI